MGTACKVVGATVVVALVVAFLVSVGATLLQMGVSTATVGIAGIALAAYLLRERARGH